MTDFHNAIDKINGRYCIDDTICPLADSILIIMAGEFFATGGRGSEDSSWMHLMMRLCTVLVRIIFRVARGASICASPDGDHGLLDSWPAAGI